MKKNIFKSRRGSSSVLIILVLLCLSVFGVLSMMSARSDLNLARRRADRVTGFYALDSRGTALLAEIAESFKDAGGTAGSDARLQSYAGKLAGLGFDAGIQGGGVAAQTVISGRESGEGQNLAIALEVDGAGNIRVTSWRQWNNEFEYDDGIVVW